MDTTTEAAAPKRNGNRGMGRKKGSKNKIPSDVRQMVLTALTEEGGVEYLRQQARENPKAFLPLVARLLPTRVEGDAENPLRVIHSIKRVIIHERRADN